MWAHVERIGNQQRHLPTTMPNGFVARKNAIDYRFVHCVRSSFGHLFILLSGDARSEMCCTTTYIRTQEEQEAKRRTVTQP